MVNWVRCTRWTRQIAPWEIPCEFSFKKSWPPPEIHCLILTLKNIPQCWLCWALWDKSRHFGGSKAVSGVCWALRIGKAVPQSRYSLRHTGPVHYVRKHLPCSLVSYIKLMNSQISGVMGKSGQNRDGFGQIRKWFSSEVKWIANRSHVPPPAVIINSYPCYAQHMLPGSVKVNNDLLLDGDFDWNFRFALWRLVSG